jgi:hypothetical protein
MPEWTDAKIETQKVCGARADEVDFSEAVSLQGMQLQVFSLGNSRTA